MLSQRIATKGTRVQSVDLVLPAFAVAAGGAGVLVTGLLLGFRHGFDWDHIAAITDITSTSPAADIGVRAHELAHDQSEHRAHRHPHGGPSELRAHDAGPGAATLALAVPTAVALATRIPVGRMKVEREAILLGTLYAVGHALVVAVLGVLALAFGAVLPDWIDPIMERVVGVTLLFLAAYLFYSLYRFFRGEGDFQLRSRWMLVFAGVRNLWGALREKLFGHKHEHVHETQRYGVRTAWASESFTASAPRPARRLWSSRLQWALRARPLESLRSLPSSSVSSSQTPS